MVSFSIDRTYQLFKLAQKSFCWKHENLINLSQGSQFNLISTEFSGLLISLVSIAIYVSCALSCLVFVIGAKQSKYWEFWISSSQFFKFKEVNFFTILSISSSKWLLQQGQPLILQGVEQVPVRGICLLWASSTRRETCKYFDNKFSSSKKWMQCNVFEQAISYFIEESRSWPEQSRRC